MGEVGALAAGRSGWCQARAGPEGLLPCLPCLTSCLSLPAAGQSWAQPASGVVVRHQGTDGGLALVSVCRSGGTETMTSCTTGVDNDCNGLAGVDDPACASMMRLGVGTETTNKG